MKTQLISYDVLESTNVTAKKAALNGAADGTVIVAKKQVGGHGRMNRVWVAPEGCLTFTIILRPTIDPQYVAQVTLLAGVAVAKAVRRLYATDKVGIKWPNDLQFDGKKICGILSEMQLDEHLNIDFAIVGIGINVALQEKDIPLELRNLATSLNLATGKAFTCQEVLEAICQELEPLYNQWLEEGPEAMLKCWKNMNCTLGKAVNVKDNDEIIFRGLAEDIDEAGALLVRSQSGEVRSFDFGEISIR